MIKKILFILFIIFISIFVNRLLEYNDEITINLSSYQIITTVGFLIFLISILILSIYLILYIFSAISSNKFQNKNFITRIEKKFNQYIEIITEGFVYKSARNIKKALKKVKQANKIYKSTNISKLLESQIYYIHGEYKKSEESFKEIKDSNLNLNLLNLKINLEQAKKINDNENIKKYSEKILKIEAVNIPAIEYLFEIYMKEANWIKANHILQIGLKANVFEKNKIEKEILFLYTSLGKIYYDNREFIIAKKFLREAYKINKNYIQSAILLIQTYIYLGKKSKAMDLIKKAWKYNTNPRFAELYFSLLNEKEKKSLKSAELLYKLNSKSYESNLILAKFYFNMELYSKARKYAKFAGNINETKQLYELLLSIEQKDNGNSTLITNLKNRILLMKNSCWKCNICKREYIHWEPACNNCKNLNSLEWFE